MLPFFHTKIKVCVHSGKFHPDDVSAVAIISLYLNKPIQILRSRDPKVWAASDYVFDVGGIYDPATNRFDHHQESFTMKRGNGIAYSSAGLAWKHFGEKIAGSHEVWQKIDEKIIQPIDAEDNGQELYTNNFEGISPYTFGDHLHAFNLTWKEKSGSLEAFEQAVIEAKKMFQREIKRIADNLLGQARVREIYEKASDKRIIVLDDHYSWAKVLDQNTEAFFVIVPDSENNTWHALATRDPHFKFKNRLNFPENWAGKRDEELAKITGVSDAIFCHKGLFIAVARSKEGAIALASLALNQVTN